MPDNLKPIRRVDIPDLALLVHEYVTGRHYSALNDPVECQKWVHATERLLNVLVKENHVRLV